MKQRGKYLSTSVSLPRKLYPLMVKRARSLRRNKSNYLLSLIEADLEIAKENDIGKVKEAQAA